MTTTWNTNVDNWRGEIVKLVAGSDDLVSSNGILNGINASDKNSIRDFTKSGSTIYNSPFNFSIVKDEYYKVFVSSSNNKISKVAIVLELGGGNYQVTEVPNNDYAIFKAKTTISSVFVQNEETIDGSDDVKVVIYHLEKYSDSIRINQLNENAEFSIKSELLYTNNLSKSGSITLNSTLHNTYNANKTYVIEVKTTKKLVSYISFVYYNDGYVAKTITVKNGYGVILFTPSIDITSVIVQNEETIEGTDSIIISSYDASESSVYELINNIGPEMGAIKDIKSELLCSFSVSKSGSTTLNYTYLKNLSSEKVYTINISTSGKISQLGIVYPYNNSYVGETIPIYEKKGYYVIKFPTDITNFFVQNEETIDGTDDITISIYDSTNTKVYRILNDECLAKLADLEADLEDRVNNSVKEAISLHHYDTGDYKSYNIKHVGIGYEYEEPMLAINSISDASETNRYLIMLHGNFEITNFNQLFDMNGNRCSREIIDGGTTAVWAYIFTKNFVDIIGADKSVQIKYSLPIVNNNQKHYLHTIYDRGTTNIANLNIEVENSRYCIHQENGSGSSSGQDANTVKLYKNLTLLNKNAASYGYTNCFGIGTAPNQNVTFENCNCVSLYENSINNIHSHSNYLYPFTYCFKNCRFDSIAGFDEVYYSDLYSGVKQSFIIEGCIFPSFGEKRQSYGFQLSISDNAHDYRNGGAYISGHGNNFVMVRETAPCLVFETTANNSVISAVSNDIVGDCLVSYEGTSDAHGVFVGTELIMSGGGSNVLNLGSRLGDCSTVNKSLIVTIDEVQQTVVFAENYSYVSDADIISYINSQLTGCTCYIGYDIQIPSFNDETVLAINNSNSTIEIGDLLVLDIANGYHSYKKCQDGDIVDAIATKRINPGDSAYVITKYHQKFNNIGGMSNFTDGIYYQADNNGKIKVATNQSNASFRCIGDNVLEWIKN